MMVVFSQYLKNVPIPLPVYTPKEGFRVVKAHVFKLFPVEDLVKVLSPEIRSKDVFLPGPHYDPVHVGVVRDTDGHGRRGRKERGQDRLEVGRHYKFTVVPFPLSM